MNLLFRIGFLDMSWIDIMDILLVSFMIYQLYQLVKGSVAVKIIVGGLAIFMLWLIVSALEMELLSTILGQFIGVGVIAALILFQQEIRKFLLVIGKANYLNNNPIIRSIWGSNLPKNSIKVDIFIEATQEMSASLTGALMVFSKSSELKFYAESGDEIDAVASKRLIISIFNKYSPLHDGAMIIGRNGRIKAARCILPVSENDELPASLGLRHRSAIGLSEVSDAVIVVVSEETGQISIVKNGNIYRNLSPKS
ncbi:MAG: TIGR00159 family protein [Bacteroidia bacterium]|nr:TIGR00159 family protein [Bacteroidia bacterium]